MSKNVKLLEEEIKRLRQEREEWAERALKLSNMLQEERKRSQEGISRVVNLE